MRPVHSLRYALTSAALSAVICVLGFNALTTAQPPKSHEPFANTTAQQAEMIQLLKEINQQLKDQNALLRTGTLQVKVVEAKAR